MTLDSLKPGRSAMITAVSGDDALRFRLLDLGLTPGTMITVYSLAPAGDPIVVLVRGYQLSLRRSDARRIGVRQDR